MAAASSINQRPCSAAPMRKRWINALLAAACILLPSTLRAESEASVKAAYIYNFTTLVKWPSSAFASSEAPLVIGVVGRSSFGSGLSSMLAGQKAGARRIEVRAVRAGDSPALRACNVVFVTSSERTEDVVPAVRGLPVLVVGEASGFASDGGSIGFVLKNQKVKIEINRAAARQAQLTIPSDLLAIATLVK